jgi:cysteine-rich repeat protein
MNVRFAWALFALACSGPAEIDAGTDAGARDAGMSDAGGDDAGFDGGFDAGEPPPGDTCAGAIDANTAGSVDETGALVLQGTNVSARTDLAVCDDGIGTPRADVIYRYTAPRTGGLRFVLDDVTPTAFAVDVRTSCDDLSSNVYCEDCGLVCSEDFEVEEGDVLFFVISSFQTTNNEAGMGDFELTLFFDPDPLLGEACVVGGRACPSGNECQELEGERPICGVPACGDGYLGEMPLVCEDGNTEAGDGCDASCMIELQGPGGETCDAPATLELPRMRDLSSSNVLRYANAEGDFAGGDDLGASCAEADGPEAVYLIDLPEPSIVELNAGNADVMSLRRAGTSDCGTEELGCATTMANGGIELDVTVPAGRYAIILDRLEPSPRTTPDYSIGVVIRPQP